MNAKQAGLVLGRAGVAALAAALVGCGASPAPARSPSPPAPSATPSARTPERVARCLASRAAFEDMQARTPGITAVEIREYLSHICTSLPYRVPDRVPHSPGCKAEHPVAAPPPVRTVPAPSRAIPFLASRSGTLPADGLATVGGVRLQRGSRCGGYWSTDDEVVGPDPIVRALAAAFPRTGLWPVLWTGAPEDPDTYAGAPGDPADADGLDVLRILRRQGHGIRALASGEPFSGAGSDPFRMGEREADVLLLVPVNRPSDVFSVLGFIGTTYYSRAELTAVARSWEERYGAVPVEIGPGYVTLVTDRTPTRWVDATRLAREYDAFQPDGGDVRGRRLAYALTVKHQWDFSWPD